MITLDVGLSFNLAMQEGLQMLARELTAESPTLRKAEVAMAESAVKFATPLTPIISGSLRTAHAVFVQGDETFVGLNPSAINPIGDERPADYGPLVHERGGRSLSGHVRAFYDETLSAHGDDILTIGENYILANLQGFNE